MLLWNVIAQFVYHVKIDFLLVSNWIKV